MKGTVDIWEVLKGLRPSTIQAIAQDLTDQEAWQGLKEDEKIALENCAEFYQCLTGEKILLKPSNPN